MFEKHMEDQFLEHFFGTFSKHRTRKDDSEQNRIIIN